MLGVQGFRLGFRFYGFFVAFGAERLRCRGEGRWVKQTMKGESCVV